MWPNPQETADLVTFTEEILKEKLDFLCGVMSIVTKASFPLVDLIRTKQFFSRLIDNIT